MPLRRLDLAVGRTLDHVRGNQCSVCGVDLVDAPKPSWSRRSGNSRVRYYCQLPPNKLGSLSFQVSCRGHGPKEATDDDRPVDTGAPNPCRADSHYSTVGTARTPEPPRVYTGTPRGAKSGILSPRVPAHRGDAAFNSGQEIYKNAPIPPPNKFGGFLGGIL